MPLSRRTRSTLRLLPLATGVVAVVAGGALLVYRIYPVWVGLSLLSLGVVALTIAVWWQRRRALTAWIPFLVGATVLFAGLFVWQHLRGQEDRALERRVDLAARGVRSDVERRVEAMTGAIFRVADPGSDAGLRSIPDLERDLRRAFELHPALLAVEWLEPDGEIRLLSTRQREPGGVAIPTGPGLALLSRAAQLARQSGEPGVVGPFAAEGGDTLLRVLVPVNAVDGQRVCLSGLFSARDAFSGLGDLVAPRYALRVLADGAVVWEVGTLGAGELAEGGPVRRLPLEVPGGIDWNVQVAATPALVSEEGSGVAEIALALSVALALLLTLTTWFGERAARRARSFQAAVAERTTELEAAKGEAQAANAAKDRFLAMLGHELRNPLASVSTALEVLQRQAVQDPLRENRMRGIVQRQMRHMAHLVDDLLDVSRIERGKLPLEPEPLDLARLVRDVSETERARIEEAGLRFELEVAPAPLWIDGDATRLTQVVYNLLSNATKFTERGGTIRIAVQADPAAESVTVSVRDSGLGIDPADLERVFEPFAQTADGIQRSPGGLGLGLPIVKGLVEAHGGAIEAKSGGRGQGVEISFRLPLREAPAEEPAPRAREEPSAAHRVLVIDDQRDSCEGLRELLLIYGHEVEVARDGAEGLRQATEGGFDVVICDLGLPGGLDGYEVARALRAHPATASVHLVALTGYGDDASVRRTLEAGFDRHLTKPVDPRYLREVLAEPARRPRLRA
jgi:signal transduction histidine kinase/ActR/RegA family two-component response regulator